MDKELLELSLNLKQALENDPRIKELNIIEKKMNDSPEVARLAQIKEEKADNYNFALSHFTESSKEVVNARKGLFEAKQKLESHPLVREYLFFFSKVREMNQEINNSIFSIINNDLCKGSKK